MRERIGGNFQLKEAWIEVFPYGMTIWSETERPVMIFKDKKEFTWREFLRR